MCNLEAVRLDAEIIALSLVALPLKEKEKEELICGPCSDEVKNTGISLIHISVCTLA